MTPYEIAFEALSKITAPKSQKNSATQMSMIAAEALTEIDIILRNPATADPEVKLIHADVETMILSLVDSIQAEIMKLETLILISATSSYARAEARKQIARLRKLLESVQQI